MSDYEQSGVLTALEGTQDDLLLIVADERHLVNRILGYLRLEVANMVEKPPIKETDGGITEENANELRYVWITNFPLFEGINENGNPIPAHHPFTMPHPDDIEVLAKMANTGSMSFDSSNITSIRSQAYDLVLNGWELGSGSVRINDPDIQQQIFTLLGISEEESEERFGFLTEAFRYGVPPHAGFAVGIDRLVAILQGEDNIREVIAFPKTQSGSDLLTGAPSEICSDHMKELSLSLNIRV